MIRATSLLCLPLLAACASPAGHFPSLDMREGERVSGTIAAPAAPPLAPSPASAGDLASLAVTAQASHAAFSEALPQARALVAAAQAGDGWSAAQVAIADLEAHRSALMIALADLDRLLVDAVLACSSSPLHDHQERNRDDGARPVVDLAVEDVEVHQASIQPENPRPTTSGRGAEPRAIVRVCRHRHRHGNRHRRGSEKTARIAKKSLVSLDRQRRQTGSPVSCAFSAGTSTVLSAVQRAMTRAAFRSRLGPGDRAASVFAVGAHIGGLPSRSSPAPSEALTAQSVSVRGRGRWSTAATTRRAAAPALPVLHPRPEASPSSAAAFWPNAATACASAPCARYLLPSCCRTSAEPGFSRVRAFGRAP